MFPLHKSFSVVDKGSLGYKTVLYGPKNKAILSSWFKNHLLNGSLGNQK